MNRCQRTGSFVLGVGLLVAACGGGSDGGGTTPPPATNAAVGGIWEGTTTISGQGTFEVVGIVAEDGRGHFIQEDGVQYWGTIRASGNAVTANFEGAVPIGNTFVDGSTSGSGSLSGTVQSRSRMTGTVTFTTSRGTRTNSTISLRYDTLYDRDSSLATVAGNYTNALAPGSDAVNVSGSGVLFGQEPISGCVLNGQVTAINSAYNAYDVLYTYSNCRGIDSVLNGSTFSGLATLDNTTSPERAFAGLRGRVAGTLYSFLFVYQRT